MSVNECECVSVFVGTFVRWPLCHNKFACGTHNFGLICAHVQVWPVLARKLVEHTNILLNFMETHPSVGVGNCVCVGVFVRGRMS